MMGGLAAENSRGHIALALAAARYIFWEHAELEKAASNDDLVRVRPLFPLVPRGGGTSRRLGAPSELLEIRGDAPSVPPGAAGGPATRLVISGGHSDLL